MNGNVQYVSVIRTQYLDKGRSVVVQVDDVTSEFYVEYREPDDASNMMMVTTKGPYRKLKKALKVFEKLVRKHEVKS